MPSDRELLMMSDSEYNAYKKKKITKRKKGLSEPRQKLGRADYNKLSRSASENISSFFGIGMRLPKEKKKVKKRVITYYR